MAENRSVPRQYDDDGLPCWHSQTSPSSFTARADCFMHPDRIIPIVFVPGIMGSNLKAIDPAKASNVVNIWRPDSQKCALTTIKLSPKRRQAVFQPNNAIVDDAMFVDREKMANFEIGFTDALAKSRGWGTVYWNSYGPFLECLERELNAVMLWDEVQHKSIATQSWADFKTTGCAIQNDDKQQDLRLTSNELTNVAKYWYPVHAVGYNWLQSNEQSGKDLAAAIAKILASYKSKWGAKAVKKVILVTHSMGGLVARAVVHPEMGKAQDSVLGILHGAMPALGAPAAYKRMKAGNEVGQWSSLQTLGTAIGTWLFLGANGWDVTPVLAQAPGGLRLGVNFGYQQ